MCQKKYSYIRLCTYWNEVEASPGVYDFTYIRSLLDICEKYKQSVVLTVGMKAPRWPEYHWPKIINQLPNDSMTQLAVLRLITRTINELSPFKCISHWQVENEPLDPSGLNNHIVPYEFYLREVVLVRSLDATRPIIGTLWGNDLKKGSCFLKWSL